MSTEQEPEYKALLSVDRSRMEDMLDTQPTRFMWAVEQLAEADKIVRDLSVKLDVVSADIYKRMKDIRDDKGKPLSEAAIKQLIPAEPEYLEALKNLNEAKYDQKIINGVVEAFSQRKAMLSKAVELSVMGYYGDPTGKGSGERFQESAEKHLAENPRLNRG